MRNALTFDVSLQTCRCLGSFVLVTNALGEQFLGTFDRRIDVLLFTILQCHVQTAQSAPGGDVATHHAGTNDVHVFDARAPTCCPGP